MHLQKAVHFLQSCYFKVVLSALRTFSVLQREPPLYLDAVLFTYRPEVVFTVWSGFSTYMADLVHRWAKIFLLPDDPTVHVPSGMSDTQLREDTQRTHPWALEMDTYHVRCVLWGFGGLYSSSFLGGMH